MKIISFDVGIKNMAYCIFSMDKTPFEIVDWNVISLLDNDEPYVYCNCSSIKKKESKKEESKKEITNFFIGDTKKMNTTTIEIEPIIPPKLCCRIGKFKKGNSIFCEKHSKTQIEWLFPESRFSQNILKKTKLEDIIKIANDLKIENIGKKRIDIMKQIDEFTMKRCLEPVSLPKQKSAGDADLVSIGKKMKEVFDDILVCHKDITHVIIENQISPIANRMKTIQGMLAQYFIMVYSEIKIEFISSINKLKMFSKTNSIREDSLQQKIKPLSTFTPLHIENAQSASPCSLITSPEGGVLNVQRCNENIEIKTQSQVYKSHKKDGVYYSKLLLDKNSWLSNNNRWSLETKKTKKKDDLADCFLQGIWYLMKTDKIKINEEYQIE